MHDFIDFDEGHRPIDWDSHLRKPFFAEAQPCESCGAPVDGDRRIAPWDDSLLVGPCCYFHEDMPVCETLAAELQDCRTVGEVRAAIARHEHCPDCPSLAPQEDAALVLAMAQRAMEDGPRVLMMRSAGCTDEECRAFLERAA